MTEDGRTITAKVPQALAASLDEIAPRIDRSRSWIVRQALTERLGEEQRRYELTLEALDDVHAGRLITYEAMGRTIQVISRRLGIYHYPFRASRIRQATCGAPTG